MTSFGVFFSSKTAKFHGAPEKSKQDRKGNVEPKEPESSRRGSSVPTVGTWEFELEDDEYMLFLDLFLSYVLGKDRLDAEESELPLLSSFSQRFHARELHSVTFDMLTSLKRRQKDGRKRGARLPLFRAGHCFQTLPVTPEPLPVQDTHDTTNATSPWTLPGIQARKHQGLFSCRQHHTSMSKVNRTGPDVDSVGFRILSADELGVQMQLDSSMEIRFPRLARLLEWMMRWADRRVLLSQPMGKRSEGSDAVVIRVKGSTPAVLSALELLEERYSAALLGENTHYSHYQVRCSAIDQTVYYIFFITDGCRAYFIFKRQSKVNQRKKLFLKMYQFCLEVTLSVEWLCSNRNSNFYKPNKNLEWIMMKLHDS